ncbi:MAG: tetratricopeptide repeat protein [Bacteroidota bacterium]
MSTSLDVIRVFIGSPGDLQKERRVFFETIDLVNKIKARSMGVVLEAVGWEDTLPGKGRPQAIINEELKTCDLIILTVWRRWGSPSGAHSSGFEEEYEVAHEAGKDIQLYFKDVAKDRLADPGDQLKQVIAFRERIEKERNYLYGTYADQAWGRTLQIALCGWLDRTYGSGPPRPPGPDPDRQAALEAEIQALKEELATLQGQQGQDLAKLAARALTHAERGELTKAEVLFAELAEGTADPSVLTYLGLFYKQIGDLDDAMAAFEQVKEIAEATTDEPMQAIAYGNLGIVLRVRGDLDGAEAMYRKALEIEERLGRLGGMANQYGNLGSVLQVRGDLDGAEAMCRKSLEIEERLGRLEGMASDYGNLGIVLEVRGDLDGAEAMHRKALEINERLGRLEGMANDYGNLGNVLHVRGDLDGAEAMYHKSLEIEERLGRLEGMANAYGGLGNVLRMRGDLDGAEAMYHKSLEINEGLGRLGGMANQYGNLGIVLRVRGDLDWARAMWTKSVTFFEELGNQGLADQVRGWLSELDNEPDA